VQALRRATLPKPASSPTVQDSGFGFNALRRAAPDATVVLKVKSVGKTYKVVFRPKTLLIKMKRDVIAKSPVKRRR
jgi:hypothetical protein